MATGHLDRGEFTPAEDNLTIINMPSDDPLSLKTYPNNTDGTYSIVATDFGFQGPPGNYQVCLISCDVSIDFADDYPSGTYVYVNTNISELSRDGSQLTSEIWRSPFVKPPAGPHAITIVSLEPAGTIVQWHPLRGGQLNPVQISITDNKGRPITTHKPADGYKDGEWQPTKCTFGIRRAPGV